MMAKYRADLHIHTVLSPCGDLSMSPREIIGAALARNLHIIGITDHNSTLQAPLIRNMAKKHGISVFCGAEVTTREEIHCLVFMPDEDTLQVLQDYLERHLMKISNDVDRFGYQLVVDDMENIIQEYPWLLLSSIDQNIGQVAAFAHSHGGLFIPAHVTRPMFSMVSQLGFIPTDLDADAIELSRHTSSEEFAKGYGKNNRLPVIRSSDAHYLADIGRAVTEMEMESPCFEEFGMALKGMAGRKILT